MYRSPKRVEYTADHSAYAAWATYGNWLLSMARYSLYRLNQGCGVRGLPALLEEEYVKSQAASRIIEEGIFGRDTIRLRFSEWNETSLSFKLGVANASCGVRHYHLLPKKAFVAREVYGKRVAGPVRGNDVIIAQQLRRAINLFVPSMPT